MATEVEMQKRKGKREEEDRNVWNSMRKERDFHRGKGLVSFFLLFFERKNMITSSSSIVSSFRYRTNMNPELWYEVSSQNLIRYMLINRAHIPF